MSLKSSLWRYLGLLAVAALAVGVMAGPASAKKLSAKQRAAVRAQLRKEIKKNPKAINKKSFVKRASLVNFTLPITIKLRSTGNGVSALGAATGQNPNSATIDLGASLGTRQIGLGGALSGELQFHDSYDGGALGNVDLALNQGTGSGAKYLTSTSIPLLWNPDVSNGGTPSVGTAWDTGLASANALSGGCSNFTGNANLPFDANNMTGGGPYAGVPEYNLAGTTPTGAFVPVSPGIDSIDALKASAIPGSINNLGSNPNPFPGAAGESPTAGGAPSVQDTVLRTTPLKLGIASPGAVVHQDTGTGPNGSQNITIGKSGGQANLFGNIPGKSYGIDVTVSLATQINSILRAVDADAQRIRQGAAWPAALFNCRQAVTGSVPNTIPGVRLKGTLKISPAITPAGDLRIAKVSLSSLAEPVPTHIALAACLSPWSVLAAQQNGSDGTPLTVPASTPGLVPNSDLPADTSTARTDFSGAGVCNSTQTQLVRDTQFNGVGTVNTADGYSAFAASSDGSKVSVSGDITVNDIEADVIIGDR